MSLINQLTMRSYALLKRNPWLKDIVAPIYRFLCTVITSQSPSKNAVIVRGPVTPCASIENWISTSGSGENWYKAIHASVVVHRLPPKSIEPIHWKFKVNESELLPGTFVASLQNAAVFEDGNVITGDNQLLTEVSKEISHGDYIPISLQHKLYSREFNVSLERIDGKVVVLSAPSGRGYYHWLFDVLPRLALIRDSEIKLEEVDYFLVNDYVSRFHIETLSILGIEKRKIKTSQWNPHVSATHLIVPSLVGNTGHIPYWSCDFLRGSFLPVANKINDTLRLLYLNRQAVSHRRVVNEAEVVTALHRVGFVSISLEALTFEEQVSLMKNASCVVAPHGAGLTNLVFCDPGTKVVEILSSNAVNIMYWTLCNQIGLEYYYLFSEGPRAPEFQDPYENSTNLKIDVRALLNLLSMAGVC